jgi:hypothetical protein
LRLSFAAVLASVDEGLNAVVDLLSRVILTQQPVDAWWTSMGYWTRTSRRAI